MIAKFLINFITVMGSSMAVFALILFSLVNAINEVLAISIASAVSVLTIVTVDKIIKPWIY